MTKRLRRIAQYDGWIVNRNFLKRAFSIFFYNTLAILIISSIGFLLFNLALWLNLL